MILVVEDDEATKKVNAEWHDQAEFITRVIEPGPAAPLPPRRARRLPTGARLRALQSAKPLYMLSVERAESCASLSL